LVVRGKTICQTLMMPMTIFVTQKRRKISQIADINKEIFPKARSFIH
jgi:hypothetical protein